MAGRQWEIGICGTFDVANYGDLLFPLIAESELKMRLGAVTFHRFSYYPKTPPEWPYQVTSVTELPHMVHDLDGLIIGGGLIIRFDKNVAPGYYPPSPEVHHPTGYWLTPAMIALQHNVPVVWNAPGLDGNEIPRWAEPLMEKALTLSSYVSVRDEPSRVAIEPLTRASVAVVPDTAFGLHRLLNLAAPPSPQFTSLCETSGLNGPYIVVQARLGMEGFIRFVTKHAERLRNFRFLALPIGPAIGDNEEFIDTDSSGMVVRLPYWPSPLLLAELIGRSEAVVGQSYHLCITALVSGVPVFTREVAFQGKYSVLAPLERIFELPRSGEPELEWFLARTGRTAPSASVLATRPPLAEHWDRIAGAFEGRTQPTSPALNQFWQSLPALLESAAIREAQAHECQQRALATAPDEIANMRKRFDEASGLVAVTQRELARVLGQLSEAQKQAINAEEQLAMTGRQASERQDRLIRELTIARAETTSREAQVGEIKASRSWRWTAPLRRAGRLVQKQARRRIIYLEQIRYHQLQTDPYQWAAINNLFEASDAARLAATYPCDHFKLVAAANEEREYEYEARSLIGMGAKVIAYPDDLSDTWRALARDLLSPGYRSAMTTLTRRDLAHALMEVNVFHYGPGGNLSPHRDLPEKIVTHVLYFNPSWDAANGGCLRILRSPDPADVAAELPPIAGYSSVLVRSENSWHAVSRVAKELTCSRRSVTVTFYRPGSVSTMWPPGDATPLHRYRT